MVSQESQEEKEEAFFFLSMEKHGLREALHREANALSALGRSATQVGLLPTVRRSHGAPDGGGLSTRLTLQNACGRTTWSSLLLSEAYRDRPWRIPCRISSL